MRIATDAAPLRAIDCVAGLGSEAGAIRTERPCNPRFGWAMIAPVFGFFRRSAVFEQVSWRASGVACRWLIGAFAWF